MCKTYSEFEIFSAVIPILKQIESGSNNKKSSFVIFAKSFVQHAFEFQRAKIYYLNYLKQLLETSCV